MSTQNKCCAIHVSFIFGTVRLGVAARAGGRVQKRCPSRKGLSVSASEVRIVLFYIMFGVLGPRCWTGASLLDCHVLKGFGIYMIGILGRLY